MKCPDCNEKMATARHKDLEFDDGDNDIRVTVYLIWCPKCKYIEHIYNE